MDFLASDAVRPRPWKTLCTATPAMRVILKGWRGYMSVEAGLWSCLPASDATARTVFNNTVDALAPSSPFLIFPSSSPPSASPAPVPSASSPPRCHRVIMGSAGRPSSFLTELLSPFPARLHLHYRYCCTRRWKLTRFTLNHRLRRICYSDVRKVVHLFSMTKPQENKKDWGFQLDVHARDRGYQ